MIMKIEKHQHKITPTIYVLFAINIGITCIKKMFHVTNSSVGNISSKKIQETFSLIISVTIIFGCWYWLYFVIWSIYLVYHILENLISKLDKQEEVATAREATKSSHRKQSFFATISATQNFIYIFFHL